MSVSNDVRINCFMRQWVEPAEAAVRQKSPPAVAAPLPLEGWRRGAQKGANAGSWLGSALLLPVDLFAGTLQGSARMQVQQAHLEACRASGIPPAPLPRKQRFLLRLEDGVLGAVTLEARRGGGYLGQAVGGLLGTALGLAAWSLRAVGAGLGMGARPGFTQVVRERAVGGAAVGQPTGMFVAAVALSLSALLLSLASAGAKGVCIGAGALAGGLVGLGGDLRAMWPQIISPAPSALSPPAQSA